LEGVGAAVLADAPGLGQIGDRGLAVPVERHQGVLHHVDDVGGGRPGGALRVIVRRVERLHHVEGLAGGTAAEAERRAKSEHGAAHGSPRQCCSLGSSTSRKASPNRFEASTMTKMARLGMAAMCGAMNRKS